MLILADGLHDVRVTLSDGRVSAPRLHDNAVIAEFPDVANASWTSPDGARHIQIFQLLAPGTLPPVEGCPSLGPLPADAEAQARAVALRSVATLYQGVIEASAVSAGRPPGTPCRASAAARSIAVGLSLVQADPAARKSASLSQGRLLLGMVNGRMAVWSVQH